MGFRIERLAVQLLANGCSLIWRLHLSEHTCFVAHTSPCCSLLSIGLPPDRKNLPPVLLNERCKDTGREHASWEPQCFYNVIFETTFHHVYHILFIRSKSVNVANQWMKECSPYSSEGDFRKTWILWGWICGYRVRGHAIDCASNATCPEWKESVYSWIYSASFVLDSRHSGLSKPKSQRVTAKLFHIFFSIRLVTICFFLRNVF